MNNEEADYNDWKENELSEIVYNILEYCRDECPLLLNNNEVYSNITTLLYNFTSIPNPNDTIEDNESVSDIEEEC